MALYICIDEYNGSAIGPTSHAAWTNYQEQTNNSPLDSMTFYEATPIKVEVTEVAEEK